MARQGDKRGMRMNAKEVEQLHEAAMPAVRASMRKSRDIACLSKQEIDSAIHSAILEVPREYNPRRGSKAMFVAQRALWTLRKRINEDSGNAIQLRRYHNNERAQYKKLIDAFERKHGRKPHMSEIIPKRHKQDRIRKLMATMEGSCMDIETLQDAEVDGFDMHAHMENHQLALLAKWTLARMSPREQAAFAAVTSDERIKETKKVMRRFKLSRMRIDQIANKVRAHLRAVLSA